MHHKYVVRDGESVWTGVDELDGRFVVAAGERDRDRRVSRARGALSRRTSTSSGRRASSRRAASSIRTRSRSAGAGCAPWFTPGHGEELSQQIAKRIGRARRRVRICSPVLTAAPVLATLAQLVSEGRSTSPGCLDRPQIEGVIHEWHRNGNVAWKLPLLERVLTAQFSGKPSTPYGAGPVHDFMHAKVTVADDVVFAGSFNLSRSGERNAENVLEIHDAALADRLAAYIDEVRARYPLFRA